MTIYHNPRCSKSREALRLLQEAGQDPVVVEYLKTPLDRPALEALLRRLGMAPSELVRRGDLDDWPADEEGWLAALVARPALMQRPVVDRGDLAVVGRPPERVLELL